MTDDLDALDIGALERLPRCETCGGEAAVFCPGDGGTQLFGVWLRRPVPIRAVCFACIGDRLRDGLEREKPREKRRVKIPS